MTWKAVLSIRRHYKVIFITYQFLDPKHKTIGPPERGKVRLDDSKISARSLEGL
jgi:hypothetical protein